MTNERQPIEDRSIYVQPAVQGQHGLELLGDEELSALIQEVLESMT